MAMMPANCCAFSRKTGEPLFPRQGRTRLFLEWVGWIAAEEHREKASLALHPNDVARPDGIRLAALTSSLRDDLKVWAFDHRRVDVVHVSWRHIVNIFVQVADADSVAKLRHQPRDVFRELILCCVTAGPIEQIPRPAIVGGVVRQHVKTGAAEMRLRTAILVQDVVVFLPRPV